MPGMPDNFTKDQIQQVHSNEKIVNLDVMITLITMHLAPTNHDKFAPTYHDNPTLSWHFGHDLLGLSIIYFSLSKLLVTNYLSELRSDVLGVSVSDLVFYRNLIPIV